MPDSFGEPAAPKGRSPGRSSLQSRSLNSFFWLFSGGMIEAILKIAVLSVLARLLLPAEFGVVSAALTVVALADVFGRIGVAPSIVQTPELTDDLIRTGFSVTIASGLLVAAAVFFSAHAIADLYDMPGLEAYVRVFSLLFIIRSFSLVSEALLQRRMQFRLIATTSLSSYLFGYGAVSVILAWMGYGPWALVIAQLVQVAIQCVLFNIFAAHSYRPGFDLSAFRRMFRFGAGLTLSQIGNYVAMNADYLIVGRGLGADALGFYSRSYLLLVQPAQLVGQMGDKVLFPAMASIQGKHDRLSGAFNGALGLSALTQLPLTAFVLVFAPEIVRVLLGDRWDTVVPLLQILISALYFRTAYKFIGTILKATGSVFIQAAWQWAYAALVVGGALAGIAFGLIGVAIGVSLAITGCFVLGLEIVRRVMRVSYVPAVKSFGRFAALSAGLFVLLWVVRIGLVQSGLPAAMVLLAGIFAATIFSASVWFVMPSLLGKEGELLIGHFAKRFRRKAQVQSQNDQRPEDRQNGDRE